MRYIMPKIEEIERTTEIMKDILIPNKKYVDPPTMTPTMSATPKNDALLKMLS
jgi:hypothetical protein